MSTTPPGADADLAQARLQAWRSRRPRPQDWAALEAILGFDEYLARARRPPFATWVEGLGNRPGLHEIDLALRAALRRDARTMARWYPPPWSDALARLAAAVNLQALDHLERGEPAPRWLLEDPQWRAIVEAAPPARFRAATGLSRARGSGDLLADWISAWLAAVPDRAAFAELARLVLALRGAPAAAGEGTARLAQLFRRHAGTPAAMACELFARLLDLQRLRAGLVQRALARRAGTVAA